MRVRMVMEFGLRACGDVSTLIEKVKFFLENPNKGVRYVLQGMCDAHTPNLVCGSLAFYERNV